MASMPFHSIAIIHQPILILKWIQKFLLIIPSPVAIFFFFCAFCYSLIPRISTPQIGLETYKFRLERSNDIFLFLLEIFGIFCFVWEFLIFSPFIKIPLDLKVSFCGTILSKSNKIFSYNNFQLYITWVIVG